jgi:hypothetical protein
LPKKKWSNLLIAAVASAAVVLSTSGMANAAPATEIEQPSVEYIDATEVVAGTPGLSTSAQSKISTLIPESATSLEGEIVSDNAITTMPTDEDQSITSLAFDGGQEISLVLPGAELTEAEGAVGTFSGSDGETFHTQVTEDGAIQIVNVIEQGTDEHSFQIKTDIPAGSKWKIQEDGSLELKGKDAEVLAIAETPWSIDANGKNLPTKFVIDDKIITQVVDTDGAVFPVVSDPSIWWTIGTSALCVAEIASLAVGAAKVIKAFAKADKIIKSTKSVIKAYNKLGGTVKSVVDKLKKYVKKKSSLTKAQISALEEFFTKIGSTVFQILGLGSCYDLLKRR